MSDRDPYAQASELMPWEDPDALNLASFSATWRWRAEIKPFCEVSFQHVQHHMERLGRTLTKHVDKAAVERRANVIVTRIKRECGDSPTLEEIIAKMGRDAEAARERVRFEKDARPDDLATGW